MKVRRRKRSPLWTVPSDEFRNIVHTSKTFSEILIRCGWTSKGSNINTLKRRLEEEHLPASHIKRGQGSNRGRKFQGKPTPLELIMVEHSTYNRGWLKKRLIDEGLLKNECAVCGLPPVWNGKPLVLRLDHKNGVSDDHRFHNLQLVCPNCDSQLPTYSGRNKKKPQSSATTAFKTE